MSSVVISGDTSGAITLSAPAVAGTNTITLPATTGTVVLTGTTPTLNGITFPATQVPSADANTLDDYEEGTWTPTLASTGGSITSYTAGTGVYTKIGRQVTITARPAIITNGTASGAILLAGLPFAAISSNTMLNGASREDAVNGNVFGISNGGTTTLFISKYDGTYFGGNGYSYPVTVTYFTS